MTLTPEQLQYLADRGISETAAARLYSADGRDLLIPHRDPSGKAYHCQPGSLAPFTLRRPFPTGNPKFKAPPRGGNRPYFSPLMPPGALADVSVPLVLIEGPIKVDACWLAIPEGFCFVGLSGVWNLKDRRDEAGRWDADNPTRLMPELREIRLTGRQVITLFDSDAASNRGVAAAAKEIGAWARRHGGRPYRVNLPSEPDGRKNGADDLIQRHGAAALLDRLEQAEPIGWPLPDPLLNKEGDIRSDYDPTEEREVIEALALVTDPRVMESVTRRLSQKCGRRQSEWLALVEDQRSGAADHGFLCTDEELEGSDIDSRWIVPDLLPRGEVTLLTADAGVGKSLLGYELAHALATGGEFLGFRVPQMRVLILQLEEGASMAARLKARGFALRDRGVTWQASRSFDLAKPRHVEQLRQMLRNGWDFVMVDSLRQVARSFDVEETSAEFGRRVVRPLAKLITDSGSAGLLIHHNAAGTGKAAGTRDIPAAVWGVFNLKRVTDGNDQDLILSTDKTRDGDPIVWQLRKERTDGADRSGHGFRWELAAMLQHLAPDLPLLRRVEALLDRQVEPITLRQMARLMELPDGPDGKVNPTLRTMAAKAAALRRWSDKGQPARYWKPEEFRSASSYPGGGVGNSGGNQLTPQLLEGVSRVNQGWQEQQGVNPSDAAGALRVNRETGDRVNRHTPVNPSANPETLATTGGLTSDPVSMAPPRGGLPPAWRMGARMSGKRVQVTNGTQTLVVSIADLHKYGLSA